jgi:phosphoribosylformylglycinamidine cyclo-ligase
MYQVFNMGSLLEFYTDENTATALIQIANSVGIDAQVIGIVEAYNGGGKVSISSEHGSFEYTKS